MTWNNRQTCTQRKPITPPSREEVIAYLHNLAERNLRRPCANGYTEFGVMMLTAAEMLEGE